MKTWKFLLICFLISLVTLISFSFIYTNSFKEQALTVADKRMAESVKYSVETAALSAIMGRERIESTGEIELSDLNDGLSNATELERVLDGDSLKILAYGDVYCRVIKNATEKTFELTCGKSKDYLGTDLLEKTSISYNY